MENIFKEIQKMEALSITYLKYHSLSVCYTFSRKQACEFLVNVTKKKRNERREKNEKNKKIFFSFIADD